MSEYAVAVHLFLGFLICGVEFLRPKFHPKVDFLRLVSVLYLIAFSLTPIVVYIGGFRETLESGYEQFAVRDWSYFLGAFVSTIGYLAIVLGVYSKEIAQPGLRAKNLISRPCAAPPAIIRSEMLVLAGLGLLLTGAGAMWIYASSVGGFNAMIQSAVLIRAGWAPLGSWPFLKPVMPLMAVASYFFFAAWSTGSSHRLRWTSGILFLPAFCGSLLAYYAIAARQNVITYLLAFIVARIVRSGRWHVFGMTIGLLVVISMTMFGKPLFNWFYYPDGLVKQAELTKEDWPAAFLNQFVGEVSFPYISTANAVQSVPWRTDFRWFMDLPLGILYNVPDRVLPSDDFPLNIYAVNTQLLRGHGRSESTVPLGLDALGYYSLGIAGTMIIGLAFGMVLRKLEVVLAVERNPSVAVLRAAMMLYMMLWVVYADPVFALQSGFALFLGIIIFLTIQRRSGSWRASERLAPGDSSESRVWGGLY